MTNLKIWNSNAIGRQLYIVIEPGLHHHGIHIRWKAWQQRPVGTLQDGELRRDELPCHRERYGNDGEGGVESPRGHVGVLLGDGVRLAGRRGAGILGSDGDAEEQRGHEQCGHGGEVE